MTQTLFQLLFSVVMYATMGLTVGIGVTLARQFPRVGEFLKQRPILGWALAFAVGSVVVSITVALIELGILALAGFLLR